MALANFAVILVETGEVERGEELLKKAHRVHCDALGTNHPASSSMAAHLARLQADDEDAPEALQTCLDAKERMLQAHGKRHQDYISACDNLGQIY